MTSQTIVLAGASGDLGTRILKALVAQGAIVRALVRHDAAPADASRLTTLGAAIARVDVRDVGSVAAASAGASCVVSALNGLRDVIVERQGILLDAAVAAGVPRFIPSDYAADFMKTEPGHNRNFDLRREFMHRAERAPIALTSVLNGAFMDMLGAEMPIIQSRVRRVLHWGSVDQPLDFTMKDDVAAYVAHAAMDARTPRVLRIAGDTQSARELAATLTEVTGERYRTLRVGGIGLLDGMIRLAKVLAPQQDSVFPPWQGMQYLRDMFTGDARLTPLDSARYPALQWSSVRALFESRGQQSVAAGVPSRSQGQRSTH